ncbi:translation initiation factor IF-2-like [Mustela putorius furo]|uniref:Translation initiation factor IF-2-like n=1 Tax=Mustela putorius furo TaxID=9669 RepID=A0A8U0RA55_MUSPF|nr:translation initiation factor IF-2-like [Mustela putorius furo]
MPGAADGPATDVNARWGTRADAGIRSCNRRTPRAGHREIGRQRSSSRAHKQRRRRLGSECRVALPTRAPGERPRTPPCPRATQPQTWRTRLRGTRRSGEDSRGCAAPSRPRRRRRLADVPFPERPVPASSAPCPPQPPPFPPQRRAELGPDAETTTATSDLHSPAAVPLEQRRGTARTAARRATGPAGRGGGAQDAGPPRLGGAQRVGGERGAVRRVSLRAGDLTPGPPPRSPPPFHFPRDSQPVWRRRLLPGSQGIPGRPRRRAGRAGPAAIACLSRRARPAASGRRGEEGDGAAAAEGGVPPPVAGGGECSASRRRLSPAVTVLAEAVSVSNSSSLSSLPIPLRGGDPACGQAAGAAGAAVLPAGGPVSTPSARAAPTSAGCVHGAGGVRAQRPRDPKPRRGGSALHKAAGSGLVGRAPTAGRTGNSKCGETAGWLAGAPGGAGLPRLAG